jgi:hypothetical protein
MKTKLFLSETERTEAQRFVRQGKANARTLMRTWIATRNWRMGEMQARLPSQAASRAGNVHHLVGDRISLLDAHRTDLQGITSTLSFRVVRVWGVWPA